MSTPTLTLYSRPGCHLCDDAHRLLAERQSLYGFALDVVDVDGRVLARHGGAAAFTVGQRRRLGVSGPEPSYVLEVDAASSRVVIGPAELLARAGLVADRVSWVVGGPPSDGPFEADVRIRYRGEDVPAVIEPGGDRVRIEFRTPQRGVAPGQSVVVYRGDELLGGGRVVDALR